MSKNIEINMKLSNGNYEVLYPVASGLNRKIDLSTEVTGVLPVDNGGSGENNLNSLWKLPPEHVSWSTTIDVNGTGTFSLTTFIGKHFIIYDGTQRNITNATYSNTTGQTSIKITFGVIRGKIYITGQALGYGYVGVITINLNQSMTSFNYVMHRESQSSCKMSYGTYTTLGGELNNTAVTHFYW